MSFEIRSERTDAISREPNDAPLRCVFPVPGTSPRTLFGMAPGGDLIHVLDAPRGTGHLTCPDCAAPLFPRRGRVRRAHFAHASVRGGGECQHAGETALHRLAKEIIAAGRALRLPWAELDGPAGREVVQPGEWVSFGEVEVEPEEDGLRPDLVATLVREGEGGVSRHRLIIEVRVSHAVDARKLALLKARGESVLEIDLSRVDRDLSLEALAEQILGKAPRAWLFHRRVERRRLEIAREQEERERLKYGRWATEIAAWKAGEPEREAARATPPRPATAEEAAWAGREAKNWALIWRAGMLDAVGQDYVFAVEPALWRALVLSVLAPWGHASQLPLRPEPRPISEALGREMRERGWVKPAFSGKLVRWTGERAEAWDPVADAVEDYFRSAIASGPHGVLFKNVSAELSRVAREAQDAWAAWHAFAELVFATTEALRARGVRLLVGGREAFSPEETCDILAEARSWFRQDPGHWYFKAVTQEALTGRKGHNPRTPVEEFEACGFALALEGDEAFGRTGRAIANLLANS